MERLTEDDSISGDHDNAGGMRHVRHDGKNSRDFYNVSNARAKLASPPLEPILFE